MCDVFNECFALCSSRCGEVCMVELKMKQLVRLQLSAPASSEIGEGNAALPLLLYFVFVSTCVYFVFRICVLCATRVLPICPCFSFLMAMTDRRRWGWMLDHCHEGVVLCSPWWGWSGSWGWRWWWWWGREWWRWNFISYILGALVEVSVFLAEL